MRPGGRAGGAGARRVSLKLLTRFFLVAALCLGAELHAAEPSADFQSQEFRSSLGKALQARFDNFATLKTGATKTGATILQLPTMSCLLMHHDKTDSYSCSITASSGAEAEKRYASLMIALTASLPGYPVCHQPTTAVETKVTSFCHYPTIPIPDAALRMEKLKVSLEVFGRVTGDRAEPVAFLSAYALGELGRHADAIKAWEAMPGQEIDERVYDQERFAYAAALKATKDCAVEKLCSASDFLAIGNAKEASRWQNQIFRKIDSEAEANRLRGYKVDPDSAKSVTLAEEHDLNARILAAEGKLNSALLALDSAVGALPADDRATARKATYSYHRALILAEDGKYARAASACRESLGLDAGATLQERFDQPQCVEIDALVSRQPAVGASQEPVQTGSAQRSVQDASIEAEIDEAAGTNNYSPLPKLINLAETPEQDHLAEWVVKNGTEYMLHILIAGPSDRSVDIASGNTATIAAQPGKYRVAGVLDVTGTHLFFGEQTLAAGRRYTSSFVSAANE